MNPGDDSGSPSWHSAVFSDTAQLDSFLNTVGLEPSQLVDVQFALASANVWRILVICRLSEEQEARRRQWLAVEAALRGRKQELPTGGGH